MGQELFLKLFAHELIRHLAVVFENAGIVEWEQQRTLWFQKLPLDGALTIATPHNQMYIYVGLKASKLIRHMVLIVLK